MSYDGPERRVHTVYVTNHTEYHTYRDVCIAVRSLKTNVWTPGHDAVGMELRCNGDKEFIEGTPLIFSSPSSSVRTSPVQKMYRPQYDIYEFYRLVKGIAPSAI